MEGFLANKLSVTKVSEDPAPSSRFYVHYTRMCLHTNTERQNTQTYKTLKPFSYSTILKLTLNEYLMVFVVLL